MSTWITLAATIFDVVWLTLLLIFLWRIWRTNVKYTNQIEAISKTLIDVAMKDAESARQAIDATRTLINSMHNLIATSQKDRPYDRQ